MNHISAWCTAGFAVLLVSCGGGGDGGGGGAATSAPVSTGYFVDSPVQGLGYNTTSGLSGVTGPNGEFQYRSGDVVNFTIGGTTIGSAAGQPQITPFFNMLVPHVAAAFPVNIARLLLQLDTAPGSDRITLPNTSPSFPAGTCFICVNFADQMAAAGIPLASETEATTHLKNQFAIWGSWATAVAPGQLQVITFLPDGTYLLADDDDPTIPGGADGMEQGTYRWDASTTILSFTVVVNTDGSAGLSNITPNQAAPPTFVIDGSGNAASFRFGPKPADQMNFTRVSDPTKPIVGAWTPAPSPSPFPTYTSVVLTLLADGTFTVANDAFSPDPAGMERGTYLFDGAAETLTLTTVVDTNGGFGVNDSSTLPATTTVNAHMRNSVDGIPTPTITQGAESLEFYPVKVP